MTALSADQTLVDYAAADVGRRANHVCSPSAEVRLRVVAEAERNLDTRSSLRRHDCDYAPSRSVDSSMVRWFVVLPGRSGGGAAVAFEDGVGDDQAEAGAGDAPVGGGGRTLT